jgi:hypothetical protein
MPARGRGRGRKVTQGSTTVHISDQPEPEGSEEFNFEALSDSTTTSDHGLGSGQGMIFHSYSLYYLADNLTGPPPGRGPTRGPSNKETQAVGSATGVEPGATTAITNPGRGVGAISTGVNPISVTTAPTNHAPDIDFFFERGSAAQGTRSICKLCRYVSQPSLNLPPFFLSKSTQ